MTLSTYRLDNESICTAWSENTPQDSVTFRDGESSSRGWQPG